MTHSIFTFAGISNPGVGEAGSKAVFWYFLKKACSSSGGGSLILSRNWSTRTGTRATSYWERFSLYMSHNCAGVMGMRVSS